MTPMAYNSKNLLRKIIDIQEIYLQYSQQGATGEFIYKKHIAPVYHISRTTFYAYLGRNAKKEIKDLKEKESIDDQQLDMFAD